MGIGHSVKALLPSRCQTMNKSLSPFSTFHSTLYNLYKALQSHNLEPLVQEWRSMKGDAGLTGVDHVGHLTGVWQ